MPGQNPQRGSNPNQDQDRSQGGQGQTGGRGPSQQQTADRTSDAGRKDQQNEDLRRAGASEDELETQPGREPGRQGDYAPGSGSQATGRGNEGTTRRTQE